nr:hypothetical protein [Salinibacter ruber]
MRIASDGGARLSVTRYKACAERLKENGRLTRALKLFRRSEFTCDDRSGLETDARDRVQQRASAESFAPLDVLFDLFLQILKSMFDFLEEATAYAANRLIFSLVQPTRAFGFSLSGGPVGSA